jgi:hypothetical protein
VDLEVAWQPGQSGNPGGRTKEQREAMRIMRTRTTEAVAAVFDILHNGETDEIRLKAADVERCRRLGGGEVKR